MGNEVDASKARVVFSKKDFAVTQLEADKLCKNESTNDSVKKIPTICTYCAVGCGFLATTENGRLINLEGDSEHPINKGAACAKGMAMGQLTAENPRRLNKVLYRAPGSNEWEEKTWDWTIDRICRRIKDTRDANFIKKNTNGRIVNHTKGLAHIGCAPFNTEESYLISKFTRALGVVYIDHVVRL